MSREFAVRLPLERAYARRSLFALELLDAVTLSRVHQGIKVTAEGLRHGPTVNSGGLFVWRLEEPSALRRITIDPGILPYQSVELLPAQLRLPPLPRPLTPVELQPRVDYAFAAGVTGLRGTLIEAQVPSPQPPTAVSDAELGLRWLDDDGVTWHDGPVAARTNAAGDFVSILRLAPDDTPRLDAAGALTARLRARRAGNDRDSADLKLAPGRVADPSTANPLIFAWDDWQP